MSCSRSSLALSTFTAVPASHPRLSDAWQHIQQNCRQYLCWLQSRWHRLVGLCRAGSGIQRVHCRTRLYRHSCWTLTSSTLLSLISIAREYVKREAGLISLSKAPCQLGNLCKRLGCTNRCTHHDWAFLTPCSQQVFHYAQELLTAEATCESRVGWFLSS